MSSRPDTPSPRLLSHSFQLILCATSILWIVVATAGLAIPPKPGPENSLTWALYKEGDGPYKCRKTSGGKYKAISRASKGGENHKSCAGFGELYFDLDLSNVPCTPVDSGDDVPGAVNPPADSQSLAWLPCDSGECLSNIPSTPWVGVVDWGNEHGWQVAHTIQQASRLTEESQPVEVRLFDLSVSNVPAISDLPWVTDAHVLEQLCTFAELSRISTENDRVGPPVALNMSFGRVDVDPQGQPSAPGFPKLIKKLLKHLNQTFPIFQVAAAGNHDRLEYPASLPGVISTGWFDPVVAQSNGELSPGLHSPTAVQALTLSYGLVLEPSSQETGEAPEHFVPLFGSSFSSALLSGWLAGWQLSCDSEEPGCGGAVRSSLVAGEALEIVPVDELDDAGAVIDTDWYLGLDGNSIEGSASQAFEVLAQRSLAGVPAEWVEPVTGNDPVEPPTVFHLSLELLEDGEYELPWLSVADLAKSEKYGPSPGARGMCRPCHRRESDDQNVRLAFGEHNALADDLYLEDVFVEIGDQIYALQSPPNDPYEYYDFIDALQYGDNAELEIEGFPVADGVSIGLRFHLIRLVDVIRFWDHEPIWTTYEE